MPPAPANSVPTARVAARTAAGCDKTLAEAAGSAGAPRLGRAPPTWPAGKTSPTRWPGGILTDGPVLLAPSGCRVLPEAASPLEALCDAAAGAGHPGLSVVSGFRSYETQQATYE